MNSSTQPSTTAGSTVFRYSELMVGGSGPVSSTGIASSSSEGFGGVVVEDWVTGVVEPDESGVSEIASVVVASRLIMPRNGVPVVVCSELGPGSGYGR
jgi:hypothetical protein